jgi:hypothetical protein
VKRRLTSRSRARGPVSVCLRFAVFPSTCPLPARPWSALRPNRPQLAALLRWSVAWCRGTRYSGIRCCSWTGHRDADRCVVPDQGLLAVEWFVDQVLRYSRGVMTDHNATTGVLVTTSWFSRTSEQFAQRNRITLINAPSFST